MSDSSRFTYNIQFAGYAFRTMDEMGAIDFEKFTKVFEEFPWGEQMRQREKMAGGCSATISVVDHEAQRALWVSVMGNDLRPTFLIGSVIYKRKKKSGQIQKKRVMDSNDSYIAPSRRSILSAFRMFFEGNAIKLDQRLSGYKTF